MQNSGISNNFQSAYKCRNSTETALLYIQNDILSAQDHGELALLLLDLSAAFYTIDHDLLLSRLTEWFGIDGVVLQWVRSYLIGRFSLLLVNGVLSTRQLLFCGVPQGSVLGPFLFTMYTTPLSSIITTFGLKHHLYADDTQIYTSFAAEDITQSLIEFMIIGNLTQRKKLLIFSRLDFWTKILPK